MILTQKSLDSSKYMIRKRPWIPKGEITRYYEEKKDRHSWDTFVKDEVKLNEDK